MKRFNKDIKRLKVLSSKINLEKSSSLSTGENEKSVWYYAGISEEEKRKIQSRYIIFAVLVFIVGCLLTKVMVALILTGLYLGVEYLSLQQKVSTRIARFEKDYPAFLISLASAVKSGKDPLQALISIRELFLDGSILKEKLKETLDRISTGETQEDAIFKFADDIKHPDIDLFRVAFILSKREGSGLYKPLNRLTRVTRQRQSFRRKTKGAVAMQKMSGYGILLSGMFIAGMQIVMNKDNFIVAIHDPMGVKIMLAGGMLLLAGIGWMMYITREKL